jgi:hypothetical protein
MSEILPDMLPEAEGPVAGRWRPADGKQPSGKALCYGELKLRLFSCI